jgi:hypothetical protein
MSPLFNRRPRRHGILALLGLALLMFGMVTPVLAQDDATPTQGERDNSVPPPPSIGADVSLPYFAPPPSMVQKELVGPYQLLKSGKIDMDAMTITLPLYRGEIKDTGKAVWYILTDTNDKGNADALGINYSAKFSYAAVGKAARAATLTTDATLVFDSGTVDFKPEHKVVPGKGDQPFPPQTAEPGSVGDADYSPLVHITNTGDQIYNAPVVAFGVDADQLDFCDGKPDYSLVHDHVAKICPKDMTVTMKLTTGFSFGRPVLYLSTESNDKVVSALEDATLAPGLKDLTVGHDDGAFSAVERIFITVNGPTGADNPQRQGLNSALTDKGPKPGMPLSPLNVFGGIPTVATDYSPLWDANVGMWTQDAIDKGYRARVRDEFEILGLVKQGWITGPEGKPYGSSGTIIDCAVAMRLL